MTGSFRCQAVKGRFKGLFGDAVQHPDPDFVVFCSPSFSNPEIKEKIYRSFVISCGQADGRYKTDIESVDPSNLPHYCHDVSDSACKCHIFSRGRIEGEKADYLLLDQNVIQLKVASQQGLQLGAVGDPDCKRGNITYFSKGARKRMIIRMAQLRRYPNIWQDFTFADDVMEGLTISERAVFSSNCIKRFKRWISSTYPKMAGFWRREWEPRKSGSLRDDKCPHYHTLIDYDIPKHKMQAICLSLAAKWVEITGTNHPAALAVAQSSKSYRWLDSKKMAQVYVSKYVAKEQHDNPDGHSYGRFWGMIGNPDFAEQEVEILSNSEALMVRRFLRRYVKTKKMKQLIKNNLTGNWLLIGRETIKRLIDYVRKEVQYRCLNQQIDGIPI